MPCRKRTSDALPKSDGQQEDRFACPLPSHCRQRLTNPKHHLFLTFYSKITAITGSVPPSPREKASAQRPTIFSYGNAGHFRLYRIILDPVGANPRVRPTMLSCPTILPRKRRHPIRATAAAVGNPRIGRLNNRLPPSPRSKKE